MKNRSLRKQAGLNLVEILIAALVLSVGLLGLAGLQVASLKSTQNASYKQHATLMIHDLLERMQSNREALRAGDYVQATSCATAPSASCSATACSRSELATYDLYSVLCGSGSADTQLLNPQLTVVCTAGDCAQGVVLTLSWTERLEQQGVQDTNGNELEQETFTLQVNAVI